MPGQSPLLFPSPQVHERRTPALRQAAIDTTSSQLPWHFVGCQRPRRPGQAVPALNHGVVQIARGVAASRHLRRAECLSREPTSPDRWTSCSPVARIAATPPRCLARAEKTWAARYAIGYRTVRCAAGPVPDCGATGAVAEGMSRPGAGSSHADRCAVQDGNAMRANVARRLSCLRDVHGSLLLRHCPAHPGSAP